MNAVQSDWLVVLFSFAALWWLGYRQQQHHTLAHKAITVPAWVARLLGSPKVRRVHLHGAATQLLGLGLLVLMILLSLTIDGRQERMDLWKMGFAGLIVIIALLTLLFYLKE